MGALFRILGLLILLFGLFGIVQNGGSTAAIGWILAGGALLIVGELGAKRRR